MSTPRDRAAAADAAKNRTSYPSSVIVVRPDDGVRPAIRGPETGRETESVMKPIRSFFLVLTCSLVWTTLTAPTALGQPDPGDRRSRSRKVFDNWNTSACEMTDTARFTLDRPVRADRIEVWYRWRAHEGSVAYTLSQDGQTLRSGVLTQGDCDPNQEKWCIAAERLDLRLRPGTYLIQTERPRVCQNPGSDGNGFVKVYGSPR